jgi:hypothetical protein
MLQARCLSLARTMQLGINPFQHRVQFVRKLRIPKSDDTIAFFLKPGLPVAIMSGDFVVVVMSAIELNNQMCRRTEKIYDVGTDRRLTSEVCTKYGNFF